MKRKLFCIHITLDGVTQSKRIIRIQHISVVPLVIVVLRIEIFDISGQTEISNLFQSENIKGIMIEAGRGRHILETSSFQSSIECCL